MGRPHAFPPDGYHHPSSHRGHAVDGREQRPFRTSTIWRWWLQYKIDFWFFTKASSMIPWTSRYDPTA
jgi:hypothetical protein